MTHDGGISVYVVMPHVQTETFISVLAIIITMVIIMVDVTLIIGTTIITIPMFTNSKFFHDNHKYTKHHHDGTSTSNHQ